MEKLKVLVVDDSAIYRRIISDAVETTGLGTAPHTASNGVIALERLALTRYDIVLLDVMMPEMDGIETLRRIKSKYPEIEVIMISGLGGSNAAVTVEALAIGALDFIVKPVGPDPSANLEFIRAFLQSLFTQIQIKKYSTPMNARIETQISAAVSRETKQAQKTKPLREPKQLPEQKQPREQKKLQELKQPPANNMISGFDVILVAASTGGPKALEILCRGLSAELPAPVLIVQHMPPDFTRVLAESLDKKCPIKIDEGHENDPVVPGRAVIAPGGHHMTVKLEGDGRRFLRLEGGPTVNGVKPAADVLFKSAAAAYQGMRVLAVVLTGMGNDGTQGVANLKQQCRCYCLTQDEKSCVVYGMPKRVEEAGLSDESLDLQDMAARIQQLALQV